MRLPKLPNGKIEKFKLRGTALGQGVSVLFEDRCTTHAVR